MSKEHIDIKYYYKKIKGSWGICSYFNEQGPLHIDFIYNKSKIKILYYNFILYCKYLIRKVKGETNV